MGSPQNPTSEQYQILEKSGQLEMLSEPQNIKIKNNELKVEMQLPRQAVSLIRIIYE
jgi:xylan 1,4-beta-xylosidase